MIALIALALTCFAVPAEAVRQESVGGESLAGWVSRLESASWPERELAQRRLAGALQPADVARVRAAFLAGGPETRLRMAHVLGDEDRLFGTAAELAVDADAVVARAGRTALQLAIERFEPRAFEAAIQPEDLWTALAEHDGDVFDVRARPRFDAREIADLLALAQPSAPRLIFDALDAGALAGDEVRLGTWREIVRDTARGAEARIVGFGVRRDPAPLDVRWVALLPRDIDDAELRAGALVERWCLDFARPGDPAVRAAAARALAAHGMPTAVAWLARAWRESHDDAAFEGLLLAARRGAAPQALQEPASRAALWDAVEALGDPARKLHAALALAAIGAPRGGGSAEFARALADLDAREPDRAEAALVVLEGWVAGQATPIVPAGVESAVRGLLARGDVPKGLRFQAARVARLIGIRDAELADPAGLLRAAGASGAGPELARMLRGTRAWPPDAWAEDETEPTLAIVLRDDELRWMLVDGWLARGAIEPAAKVLARVLAGPPRATERIREQAPTLPSARAAVAAAARLRGLSADEAQAWFACCGVATEAERSVLAARFAARAPTSEVEWHALAELCTGATGPGARDRLVSILHDAGPERALTVATRAVRALRGTLDDAGERTFLQAVRGSVRADRGSPLDRAFGPGTWPPPLAPAVTRLGAWSRDPARAPR